MDSRRRARLILIVGVLLAILAGAGTFFVASSSQTAAPPLVPTSDVVVAARDILPRTQLTEADVKIAKVNAEVAPPAALKDTKEVIGKIATTAISINEPVLPTKYAAPDKPAFTVLPPGEELGAGSPAYRAMSITVSDAFAVGGVIQPGDFVDIVYTINFDPQRFLQQTTPPDPTKTADFSAKIVLGPVPILARTAAVYTIRVDAATAERIAYLQAAGGTLQFLLRAPGDVRSAGTPGVTFSNIFQNFRFPIPERVRP